MQKEGGVGDAEKPCARTHISKSDSHTRFGLATFFRADGGCNNRGRQEEEATYSRRGRHFTLNISIYDRREVGKEEREKRRESLNGEE